MKCVWNQRSFNTIVPPLPLRRCCLRHDENRKPQVEVCAEARVVRGRAAAAAALHGGGTARAGLRHTYVECGGHRELGRGAHAGGGGACGGIVLGAKRQGARTWRPTLAMASASAVRRSSSTTAFSYESASSFIVDTTVWFASECLSNGLIVSPSAHFFLCRFSSICGQHRSPHPSSTVGQELC